MELRSARQILFEIIRTLLRPLARFCIARSVAVQEFIECSKGAFIDIAVEELKRQGSTVNSSRISVLTGLRRSEVDRLYRDKPEPTDEPIHLIGRVIGQWEQDHQYCTAKGQPKVISYEGDDSEFFALVRKITTHVGPVGILEEMKRTGAVECTSRGLKLLRSGAVYDSDMVKGFEIIARDVGDLIDVGEANLRRTDDPGHPHARTYYDNVYVEDLPQIKKWLLERTKAFHKTLREFLAQHDKDLANSSAKQAQRAGGAKITVSTFGITKIS
jgi:hypothetical protein